MRGLIVLLCLLVSACASVRPVKYYRLDVPAPVPVAAGPVLRLTLQVGNIEASSLMRNGRILYQVGTHELGAYEYHRWVETPDRMTQNALVRLLRSSGKYLSVNTPGGGGRADYIVQGKIYEFAEVDKPQISTRVSLEIELRDTKTTRTVWSRLYTHEEPVDGKEVPNVVESLDQNLRRGLSEIIAGLDQYLAGQAPFAGQ